MLRDRKSFPFISRQIRVMSRSLSAPLGEEHKIVDLAVGMSPGLWDQRVRPVRLPSVYPAVAFIGKALDLSDYLLDVTFSDVYFLMHR